VKLVVFDISGREVGILVDKQMTAGSYKVDFPGEGLSSGIYFYRLITDEFTETKKMLMLK
jgi:hypothetical protein